MHDVGHANQQDIAGLLLPGAKDLGIPVDKPVPSLEGSARGRGRWSLVRVHPFSPFSLWGIPLSVCMLHRQREHRPLLSIV